MKITRVLVEPARGRLTPAINLHVTLEVTTGFLPVAVAGEVRAADGIILGRLLDEAEAGGSPFVAAMPLRGVQQQALDLVFVFETPPEVVEHLDVARHQNPRADVALKLELRARVVTAIGGYLALKQLVLELPGATGQMQQVRVFAVPNSVAEADSFAPQDSPGGFLQARTEPATFDCVIAGSTWVHDFAPVLGLGRFIVVEIPEPAVFDVAPDLRDVVARALQEAADAREKLVRGHYDDAMEALRQPAELLRSRLDGITQLLIADGYTTEAANHFSSIVKAQFELCSKFLHGVGKDGLKVNPALRAKREDVLLVYSATMNLLNLVARKSARHAQVAPT
jgi:hypothetical protein